MFLKVLPSRVIRHHCLAILLCAHSARLAQHKPWAERAGIAKRSQTAEGLLVGMLTFTNSWVVWKMHPKGSEVVMCTTGAITLIQEAAGGAVVEVTRGAGRVCDR